MYSVADFCFVTVIRNNNYGQAIENCNKPSYSSGTNVSEELAASTVRLLRKSKLLTNSYYRRLEQDMWFE